LIKIDGGLWYRAVISPRHTPISGNAFDAFDDTVPQGYVYNLDELQQSSTNELKLHKHTNKMKGIFSLTALLTLAAALVSGAPLTPRAPSYSIPANDLFVVTNPNPATILTPDGTNHALVSITDGSNEIDTIATFYAPGVPPPTAGSTCQFVIQNTPPPTGSGIVQLFTLGAPVSAPLTSVPFTDQYEGQYNCNTNPSTPIDVLFVPCVFDANGNLDMQFLIRPQGTDDFVEWWQSSTVGAFVDYTP
jgi:hypothetical protein